MLAGDYNVVPTNEDILSADLAPKLVDAGAYRWVRDRPNASDHAPTWIKLESDSP